MMLKEVGIDRPYVISGKPEHCWMEEKLKKKAEEEEAKEKEKAKEEQPKETKETKEEKKEEKEAA